MHHTFKYPDLNLGYDVLFTNILIIIIDIKIIYLLFTSINKILALMNDDSKIRYHLLLFFEKLSEIFSCHPIPQSTTKKTRKERFNIKICLFIIFASFFSATAQAQKALNEIIYSAQQIIVHLPTLNNRQVINSLKIAHNLNIPMRILTTNNGIMQRNGLLLTLVILDIPVFQISNGGDKRNFIEIETKAGWLVFDLSHGNLITRPVINYLEFNIWYSKNMHRLPRYIPELTTARWVKAHLGHTLTFTYIKSKYVK